jgi:ribonuclease HII
MSTKKNSDYVSAIIIDDDDDDDIIVTNSIVNNSIVNNIIVDNDYKLDEDLTLETVEEIIPVTKSKRQRKQKNGDVNISPVKKIKNISLALKMSFDDNINIIELGIDEAGRGPMFGRVYAGVVVLPKDDSFDHFQMKDSKKFHSKKKIEQVAEYIKANAIAWAVEYEDEQVIDEINILQATQSAMHKGIKKVLEQLNKINTLNTENVLLLVDGNYFKPYTIINKTKTKMETIKFQMIEGGDNKYTSIAAASILAKVERDKYIEELCVLNPELIEKYGIDSNKGYGSKKHMDGIKQYGITKWHRKTFGICKEFA